jgi:hypothetical protein
VNLEVAEKKVKKENLKKVKKVKKEESIQKNVINIYCKPMSIKFYQERIH